MKISLKLLIAFILAVLFSSVAGIVGISLIHHVDKSYDIALQKYGFAQGDIGVLGQDFQTQRILVLYMILANTTEKQNDLRAALNQQQKAIELDYSELADTMQSPEEKKLYEQLNIQMQEYNAVCQQVLTVSEESPQKALQLFVDEAAPLSQAVTDTISSLLSYKTEAGIQMSERLLKQSNLYVWLMEMLICISFIVSIIIALRMTKGIVMPIKEIKQAADAMSKGNLDIQIAYEGKNELGEVANSMQKTAETLNGYIMDISTGMAEVGKGNLQVQPQIEFSGDFIALRDNILQVIAILSDTIYQIQEAAKQVTDESKQVAEGAQMLSSGASEQASAVEELTAMIEDISHHVKKNAENAENASYKSTETAKELDIGKEQMSKLMEAMIEISNSSGEIKKIIKTIEEIAFQTNLLALNAAVEAARAGTSGKGFAVVADEVGNLASKSAKAAQTTTQLIENSLKSIESGALLAEDTAYSFSKIVDQSNEAALLVEEISKASKEQAEAIFQVTAGLDQISSVVQNNSATSEESAAASEALFKQAQLLKELVSRFQLKDQ